MRLFVAVWPPPGAVAELLRAVEEQRPGPADLRWTPSSQWHLTLAFLGQVPGGRDATGASLEPRLARAAARGEPIRLRLRGAGRFGDRILYTGVDGDTDALRRLAASVGAAARRAGIDMDDRPYRPHLTLARAGRETDLHPLVAALQGFEGVHWVASELTLVHSRPSDGVGRPPRYDILTSWPLGGPPA